MKILYIDPIYQLGHVNFNQIYIDYLYSKGYEIDFVLIADYSSMLTLKRTSHVYSINSSLLKHKYSPLLNRLLFLLTLLYIKIKFRFGNYDRILFSSYEEISFYLSGIRGAYLINHVNIQGLLFSNVKKYFFRRIFAFNSAVVLTRDCIDYLKDIIPISNIVYSSHGLPNPYLSPSNSHFKYLFDRFRYIIFSPSDNSSDVNFLSTLVDSLDFINFLRTTNSVIVIRSKSIRGKCISNNVLILNDYLSNQDYQYLLCNSNFILLAYPNSFKYRVSGVLFECFSNNKLCLISDISSMRYYSSYFSYNPFFSNSKELINLLRREMTEYHSEYFNGLLELSPSLY